MIDMLHCIAGHDRHGLYLRSAYQERTGRLLGIGPLYDMLEQLEDAGYVTSQTRAGPATRRGYRRKHFMITEAGRERLTQRPR